MSLLSRIRRMVMEGPKCSECGMPKFAVVLKASRGGAIGSHASEVTKACSCRRESEKAK